MRTNPRPTQMKYWEEQELRDLCASVGLQDFRRDRTWQFILFAATKPRASGDALSSADFSE